MPEVGGMCVFSSSEARSCERAACAGNRLAARAVGTRQSAAPAPARGLAGARRPRALPPARRGAEGGPRGAYRGGGARRAQRRGARAGPGGLAGAGRRRVLPLRARGAPAPGWRVRGSFGAREAPRPYRCAQGIREEWPPPPPPWPVALGQGAEVGVLLAVPSHQATVAIRAACRSRFPSGPRAQNLPGRGEQGSSCPSLRLDRRLGRGPRVPAAAPSATVHPVACGPPAAPEILAGVSGASLSPRAPGRAGYKDTRSQERALRWRVRQGSPCLPS